jgi:hypothetical protein
VGDGGVAPLILNFSARWKLIVSFSPRPLYLRGTRSSYVLNLRLGVLHNRNICNLKISTFIVRVAKFRTGKARNAYRIIARKAYWKTPVW